ncbi:nuclear transport factor 2 family protein [Lutibacter sp.]|uniref:nuclear transport factor 2 family protein n=1 Tax=Lutibacter sp. TaxID=1925666 RepID=UPI0025BD55EA|nr:nuclear transport factor 2 family protein [Lutibacter sp.]MCF6167177.1 nuclear transport factor 2 family protein [Lutibacter sp.]
MNTLKTITTLIVVAILFTNCTNNKTTDNKKVQTIDTSAEKQAVFTVLKNYKDAIQSLNAEGTLDLFSKDSEVYESGGSEGSYSNYLGHHLGPELDHFNSFIFSDYKANAVIDLPYAFTTETYVYTIDLKANEEKGREARIINKKGVATSILKKTNGVWKIIKTHSSSRANKKH